MAIPVITWGQNPSLLPKERPLSSPFSSAVVLRFLIDNELARADPDTGTLIGFGQVADNTTGVNLTVYNVTDKDSLLISLANMFEARLDYVVTNGNIPGT